MRVDIRAGRAHLNGVSYFTENKVSRSYMNKRQEVTVSVKDRTFQTRFYDRIPFIRGFMLPIETLFMSPKLIILICVSLLLFYMSFNSVSISIDSIQISKSIPPIAYPIIGLTAVLLCAALIIQCTRLGKFHAAEHMVDKAYSSGEALTVENVMKQRRVHENCGTNLTVFIMVIFIIMYAFQVNFWICFLLSFSIGYELYLVKGGWLRILISPFYWAGSLAQYYLFTSKPTTLEIEAAIAAINELTTQME